MPPVVKSENEWVTVMIRNLPNNYGRNDAPGHLFEALMFDSYTSWLYFSRNEVVRPPLFRWKASYS